MSEFNQTEIKRLCVNYHIAVREVYRFRGGGQMVAFMKLDHNDGINRLLLVESNSTHTLFAMRSILQWQEHVVEDSGVVHHEVLADAVFDGVKLFPSLVHWFYSIHRKVESILAGN